jgi:hypothetical protein
LKSWLLFGLKARVETGQGARIWCFPNSNSWERRENAKAGYVYHLCRRNYSRWLFGLYTGADVAVVPFNQIIGSYFPQLAALLNFKETTFVWPR